MWHAAVRRGRIGEILAGTVKIKATMQFGDFTLFEKTLPPIALPGELEVARAAA